MIKRPYSVGDFDQAHGYPVLFDGGLVLYVGPCKEAHQLAEMLNGAFTYGILSSLLEEKRLKDASG